MADQAAVSATTGNGVRINAPVESMVGSIAEFGNDLSTLAELQAKLALYDLKEMTGRALVPAVLTASGLGLLLGSLPVVLIGVAELLHSAAGLDRPWAYLSTGLVAIVVALALALLAGRVVIRSFSSFDRSREELVRNLAWIKTVLVYSGRASANAASRQRR